ncbi:MAG: hypothetical protein JSV80_06950 [Acidobacteriota bacterium]|nr:MAG: hypothetical protein JSV80_06950 [Acidobacteriota bacterium]
MSSRTIHVFAVCALAPVALAAAENPLPPLGTPLPPVQREQVHFKVAEQFVDSLGEGVKVRIEKSDGAAFTLQLTDGRWRTELPPSVLDESTKTLTTPLGYSISWQMRGDRERVQIEAPSGVRSQFSNQGRSLVVQESDGGIWTTTRSKKFGLRLPDATRIDMLELRQIWDILTLNGERYRLDVKTGEWTELPAIPSPPLLPDTDLVYLAGDGDDWRYPVAEDHIAFAWNWFPYGLAADRVVEDIRDEPRRHDINYYFQGIDSVQTGAEVGAYILGRRLALVGGDRLYFALPGKPESMVLLLPGPIDPDYWEPGRRLTFDLPAPRSVERED